VLWVIITVTYSLATAVRTELVEVRTFEACDELSRAFDRLTTNGCGNVTVFVPGSTKGLPCIEMTTA